MRSGIATVTASLAVRNFRIFAAGQIVSVAGTWMMIITQDWLVLQATGRSPSALATLTAVQFLPMTLSLAGGRLADRYDKRLLLIAANLISAALAGFMVLSAVAGHLALWQIYVTAGAIGLVNAVEVPTRMAFVGELVGPTLLPNASALSAAYFTLARIAGPAAAGALLGAVGVEWVLALNVVSYLATVAGLRLIRTPELHRRTAPDRRSTVSAGLRYIRARGDLSTSLLIVAIVAVFGMNFQLTLPLMTVGALGGNASAYGLTQAAFGAGSLAAALFTTTRRSRPTENLLLTSAFAFGVCQLLASAAPTLVAAGIAFFFTGCASIYFAQAANHRIQLGTDLAYRGRVLALYALLMQGSVPVGAVLVAALSEHLGPRSGLVMGGIVTSATALIVVAARWRCASHVDQRGIQES